MAKANKSDVVRMGRPPVFTGTLKANIVKVIKAHGLMRGQVILATEGVQAKPGAKKAPVSISLPTLSKFATEAKIKFKRGRPALALAA